MDISSGRGGRWFQFGPLIVALGYGLGTYLPGGLSVDDLYWQSPLFFSVLAGLAIAYACRPVLYRIPWTRPAAFGVACLLLGGIGQFGSWLTAALAAIADVTRMPIGLPRSPLSLLVSLVAAAALMAWCYRPVEGTLGGRTLASRIVARGMLRIGLLLALLGAWALIVRLLPAWLDAYWEDTAAGYYAPLVYPNPWLHLEGVYGRTEGFSGATGAATLLALLWLRGVLMAAPLLPIGLVLRGTWLQLTLVFGVLLFVLGEFAPLMLDQPYPSATWLIVRTLLGIARAVALGGMAALLLPGSRPGR